METFERELLEKYSKWNEKTFVKKQLLKHLDEIKELINNENEHQYNELLDLIVISKVYLLLHKSENEINDIVEKRLEKFKINSDINQKGDKI